MPAKLKIEDINPIMEFATLHGRIENWVFQTSVGGSQQIKIVKKHTYDHNEVATALRIRARAVMRYAMRHFNPSVDTCYSDFIKAVYLDTIYLFIVPEVFIKTQYLNITHQATYTIYRSDQTEPIYKGILDPRQSFILTIPDTGDLSITCYKDTALIHSINIRMVSESYDIERFFDDMFELVNYMVPVFDYPEGMVFVSEAIIFAGTAT
ncbi:MAG: hypothetical protein DRH79_07015 [Candidatus Cloacimonadota bacterium]|nr:MAG: hypothetical protein DRH79_07015 [Candidatus Cloacimonadota bacterium]